MKLSIVPLLATLLLAPATSALTIPLYPRQNSPINQFLSLIADLFPVNVAITAIGDAITNAEEAVSRVLGIPTVESDLVNGQCGDVIVIFARGTTEPGNVGAIVGPPFFQALESRLKGKGKSLSVQGVDGYAADVQGYLEGGDAQGSSRM
jgi:cutinase